MFDWVLNEDTLFKILMKIRYSIPSQYIIPAGSGVFGQWRLSGVFIVSFEHISHLVLVLLFLTLNM